MLVSKSYKRRNTSSCYVVWIAHVQWHASNSILSTCKKVIIIVSLWLEASDPVTSLSFVFFSLSAIGNNDEFKKSDPHTYWTISAIALYVRKFKASSSKIQGFFIRKFKASSSKFTPMTSAVQCSYEALLWSHSDVSRSIWTGFHLYRDDTILDFLVYCLAIMLLTRFLDLLKDVTLSDFSPFRGDAKLLICP